MSFRSVVNGQSSFQAAGFSKTVLVSQIGFLFQQSVFRKTADETPAFDARYSDAMGDSGLPPPVKLDSAELVEAFSAAFTLLVRHMSKADPDTGRKPEYLRRYLKGPKEVIEKQVNWQLSAQKSRDEATAAMLGADATKRVEALRRELTKQAEEAVEPWIAKFCTWLATHKGQSDEELCDTCLEAMVNAGRDPEAELRKAAQLLLDAQRKRYDDGQFVAVDAGIYALAKA